jgi:hypothetical protein
MKRTHLVLDEQLLDEVVRLSGDVAAMRDDQSVPHRRIKASQSKKDL